jgi:putative phosphoesterase
MKIAVLSDSHDHIWNLQKVIDDLKNKVESIIHCGDVVAGFSVKIIASANLPTHICLGNNDEDHLAMFKNGNKKFTWVHVGQQFGELEIGNRKIAFCHYPKLAGLLAKSDEYDAVFYGHTHKVENKSVGKTLITKSRSCVWYR